MDRKIADAIIEDLIAKIEEKISKQWENDAAASGVDKLIIRAKTRGFSESRDIIRTYQTEVLHQMYPKK